MYRELKREATTIRRIVLKSDQSNLEGTTRRTD